VVVDAFDASYQLALVKCLRMACRDRHLELVVFAGGILGAAELAAPQRNSIYRLIHGSGAVQGLVLLGSTIVRQRGEVQAWCERLRPLPLCSIGLELAGVPSILPDNQGGIRALVRHLVSDHGYRRLAFVSGPAGNQESRERHEAFCAELTAQGLDSTTAPCIEGDFLPPSGRDAARQLLDRDNLELDAILAANDYMAMGVLEVLSTRSSLIQRRIAVTGFDNVAEAAFTVPPLTTVEQPLRALAEAAISSILLQLQGGEGAASQRLDTRLWLRRSCGCKETGVARVSRSKMRTRSEDFEPYMTQRYPKISAEMQRASEGLFVAMSGWDQQLLSAFVDQARGVPGDPFLNAVDRMLQELLEKRAEVWRFHGVLSVLRTYAIEASLGDQRRSLEVDDLLHAARLMTGAAAMRAQAREHATIEEVQRVLNRMGARLSACGDLASLQGALDQTLPSFGVHKAFLITYEGEAREGRLPAKLQYCLNDERPVETRDTIFDARGLLPVAVWDSATKLSWTALPLFAHDRVLGFALIELFCDNGADYEALRIHLSSALANALAPADAAPPKHPCAACAVVEAVVPKSLVEESRPTQRSPQ
jgi:DNA-binding LacI/PurR family transcriptional regulator